MTEKIFNNTLQKGMCPFCKGDLSQYYMLETKRILGIRISETVTNFFYECDDCGKKVSTSFVETATQKPVVSVKELDGVSIEIATSKISGGKTLTTTTISYNEKIPNFTDEKMFIEIFGKIVFAFYKIGNLQKIDLGKTELLKEKYEKELNMVFQNIETMPLEGIVNSISEEFAIFCRENTQKTCWYVLQQAAYYVNTSHFVRNSDQESIIKNLMKINGVSELKIDSQLLQLYSK